MIVAVPKESASGEQRVALTADAVAKLTKAGLQVVVGSGAGSAARFSDDAYQKSGATIEPNAEALFRQADVVLKIQPPTAPEVEWLKEDVTLIALVQPLNRLDIVKRLAERRITCFSMDLMPRITRAQSMDVLSSMSTVTGYLSVILAAQALGKFFPMLLTAAGMIPPTKVFVIGAGVAGLQAIATARRLGAVVEANDMRPAVKEQVLSLGARFVELPLEAKDAEDKGGYAKAQSEEFYRQQQELITKHVQMSDVVITSAQVPGKRAPILITEAAVKGMRSGSVIVDLSAEQGGNCILTEPGKNIVKYGVTILGLVNVPSMMPYPASQMYSNNISNFFFHLCKDGRLNLNLDDELTRAPLVTHEGKVLHPQVQAALTAGGVK